MNKKKKEENILNETEKEVFRSYVGFIEENLSLIFNRQEDKKLFLEIFEDSINMGYNQFCAKYMKKFRELEKEGLNLHIVNYLLTLNQDVSLENENVNSFLTIPYNVITEGKVSKIETDPVNLKKKVMEAKSIMKSEVILIIDNLKKIYEKEYSDISQNKKEFDINDKDSSLREHELLERNINPYAEKIEKEESSRNIKASFGTKVKNFCKNINCFR